MVTALRPPADSRSVVEIAPGIYVPESRYDEVMAFIACNPAINEAIAEIILERTSVDPLTDDLCIYVPFWFVAGVERDLADRLLNAARANERHAEQVRRSVANFAVSYGKH